MIVEAGDCVVVERPIAVFEGPVWEAMHLEARLIDAGIPVAAHELTPVEMLTSGGRQIHVPLEHVDAARALVEAEQQSLREQRRPRDEHPDPDVRYLQRLTRPMPWYAVSIFLAPVGATTGLIYVVQAARLGKKSPQHREILLWWAACVLLSLVAAAMILVASG